MKRGPFVAAVAAIAAAAAVALPPQPEIVQVAEIFVRDDLADGLTFRGAPLYTDVAYPGWKIARGFIDLETGEFTPVGSQVEL